ncbi:MAG: hypothetical protein ABGW56_00585 [Flavobacteriaceae bacterium]|jgi:hypothetical protein
MAKAKNLLKKAKKAVSSVKKHTSDEAKKVEKVVSEVRGKRPLMDLRDHVEKLASERRDCATIWILIKDNPKYKSHAEVVELITAKGYETLLGEIS